MKTQLDADRIAHALTDRPKMSGESWRVPCPAHGGDGPNLSLRNGDGGRLLTYCHSLRGCSFKEHHRCAARAGHRRRTLTGHYTYPPDHKGFQKVVTRIDFNRPVGARRVRASTALAYRKVRRS